MGGFLVSVLPPLLRLPLQALGFGAGGGDFCLQERYPSPTPPPAPAVSLHCHTAVSTHADRGGGGQYHLCPSQPRGRETPQAKPAARAPPPPRPVLIIKRLEHRVTGVCELQISQADQQGNWQEQALRCYSFRARGHSHPQALPPSPRASLLSIHSKSIFLPFADAQFQQ